MGFSQESLHRNPSFLEREAYTAVLERLYVPSEHTEKESDSRVRALIEQGMHTRLTYRGLTS